MIFRKKFFFANVTLCLLTLSFLTSCFQPLLPRGENGSLVIHIAIPSYSASTETKSEGRFIHPDTHKLVLTVTANDMSTLTETKTLSLGESEIVIELDTIPRGRNRKINIALYDADNTLLAEGSTIAEIQQNTRNAVAITAIPVTNKILVVGTPSEIIPASDKGKTRVYSVEITEAETYIASSTPTIKGVTFNMYNNAGKNVPASEINSFPLTAGTYFLAASLPKDYANGARIIIKPPITYIVTYLGNGGTSGTTPTDSNYYITGSSVTVPAAGSLVKTGAIFAGWNTAADGRGTLYAAEDTFTMGSSNVTLYAQWQNGNLTVTVSFENPGEPTFSFPGDPGVNTVAVSGAIEVTAAPGFDSYQWLLNGVVQTNETPNSITLTPRSNNINIIIPGWNTLTLIVQSGEKYYSADFKFTVTQ